MNYKVVIEPDAESGGYVAYCPTLRNAWLGHNADSARGYVAYCPTLRGCVSEGETTEEALGDIKKAMKGYLLVLEEELAQKKDAKTACM